MPNIKANNINIEYDTFGDPGADPLLLVMGLGAQMIAWDPDFCELLAGKGHYVIRYDNRDVGLSTYFDEHGEPDMQAMIAARMSGDEVTVPYTLEDMAGDGMALLTELGINAAHICGASLGGMIVQTMAIEHPDRVLSMTSIMSTTGNPELPPATPAAMAALASERKDDPEHAMQRAVDTAKVIGSTGWAFDEASVRQRGLDAYERAYYPPGISRQMAAVMANGDRRQKLQQLDVPALIIHGDIDPLVPVSGGIDTHENIPGAELLIIEGMGHDMPRGAWQRMADGIRSLTSRAGQSKGAAVRAPDSRDS